MVRQMRSFDFSIQLRCSGFDVVVLNTDVFNMPVKLCLKLVPSVCSNGFNSERKFLDNIIYEFNSVSLIMQGINLQCPDPGGIVNGSVLKSFYRMLISIL